ncbi:MAG: hypothetical protein ACYTET_03325 [Planctomycetota bacterium]
MGTMKRSRHTIIVLVVFVIGCPGGGGSTHRAPKYIEANKPKIIQLELTAWGAGRGRLDKRYTEVNLHYRLSGTEDFISIETTASTSSSEKLIVQATLPPFEFKEGSYVEYYFDMYFDGHYNKRNIERVPIRKSL